MLHLQSDLLLRWLVLRALLVLGVEVVLLFLLVLLVVVAACHSVVGVVGVVEAVVTGEERDASA